MSEEEKKKESGEISRREFLKDAGLVVGGAAIGSTVLLAACGEGEVTTETVTTTVTETVSKYVCPYDGMEFSTLSALETHCEAEHPAAAAIEGLTTLTVNGQAYVTQVKPNWTLDYVLREKLGFTGTKRACETGDCGVCTLIMDGRPVMSCLVLAVEANGKSIETIEGLAKGGALHPLQQAFIDNDAMQCGFCTPGQIMTAKALLDFNSNPTKNEVKEFMAGTLCRCGSNPYIVDAILEAA